MNQRQLLDAKGYIDGTRPDLGGTNLYAPLKFIFDSYQVFMNTKKKRKEEKEEKREVQKFRCIFSCYLFAF